MVPTRIRFLALFGAMILVIAACSSNEPSDTLPGEDPTSTTTTLPVSATTSTVTSTTTTEPDATATLTLDPINDDPVENLTIEPLESIEVQMVGDIFIATFPETDEEIRVEIVDAANATVSCGPNLDGDQQCSVFNADGTFSSEIYELDAIAPGNIVAFPAAVEPGSFIVSVAEMPYVGAMLRFQIGPVFVQIDPNTGGLAEPVTRRIGEATASEVADALS